MNRLPGIDRFLRFLIGILSLQAAVFLLDGVEQIAAYAVAGLLLTTAILNACPVYRLLGRQACEVPGAPARARPVLTWLAIAVLVGVAVCGTWLGLSAGQVPLPAAQP